MKKRLLLGIAVLMVVTGVVIFTSENSEKITKAERKTIIEENVSDYNVENANESTNNNEEDNEEKYKCYCDGYELTTKEKYEELLIKILTDERNWLDDGKISKETYDAQIEPFNKALEELETDSDEEIKEKYREILLLNWDWIIEDRLEGYEADEEFVSYIKEELECLN